MGMRTKVKIVTKRIQSFEEDENPRWIQFKKII